MIRFKSDPVTCSFSTFLYFESLDFASVVVVTSSSAESLLESSASEVFSSSLVFAVSVEAVLSAPFTFSNSLFVSLFSSVCAVESCAEASIYIEKIKIVSVPITIKIFLKKNYF